MKWKVLPKKSDDLVEQLLANRGIKTTQEKEQFFHPKISDYEKDIDIAGIKKAQERIKKAIKNNELIIVYGDYDVDGICGCACLYKALTSIGAKVLPYIPHREKEGYGLSKIGLESAKNSGARLIITVDNGIVANPQADYAKILGLDLIITDHHIPAKIKPDAYEIIHSTKMCGAAVGWCLIRGLIKKDLATELLQFVCLATICDVMLLLEVNRAYVSEGLKILNRTTNLGLLSLINESGLRLGNIGSYEIGHVLGPRLNAMGRLENAMDSLRLLCTKDPQRARNLARLLCKTNTSRQKMTEEAVEEAHVLVNKGISVQVLHSKKWSMGIVGLIAGRIAESYSRPTIAISVGETVAKGSARSVNGVNIVEFIRNFSDILIDVGGHPQAAGFSLESKNVTIFKRRVEEYILELPEEGEKVLEIDAEVETKQISKGLIEQISKFEPFGVKNPRPIFATYKMQISDIRTVGLGKHLKFKANNIDAIAFGMGEMESLLANGQQIHPERSRRVDLAYTPEIDSYNDFEKLQLKVKDIRIS
ncbi:MAG: single-stranded-DNA-specific exonuclease RecJ [Candidatus Daviesbacteria bacterium]|nr:single-stranded-DNA-specific exonuclease RecJ [Candidatus Daviesbacteria bacterium]